MCLSKERGGVLVVRQPPFYLCYTTGVDSYISALIFSNVI